MARKQTSTNPRPTVSIIGIGRVGHAMAKALQSAGYEVAALVLRDSAKAKKARRLFPQTTFAKTMLLSLDQLDRLPPSDVILITTPDDAIEQTAKKIAAVHHGLRHRAALHTSGALSSEVLAPLTAVGFSVGSIHPLVAVDARDGESALRGAFYCIEGHKIAVASAKSIALDLGGTPVLIEAKHKVLYHAAALMASPHLIALFDLAVQLMILSGVKRYEAQRMLLSLVESTARNLQSRPPSAALTGTFARGDAGTVERHLEALSKGKPKPPPDALEIYKLLGLRSLQLAKEAGLDPKKIKQITKLLKSEQRVSIRLASLRSRR